MSEPLKCRPTRFEKYIEKIQYFAKFCFLVYELPFLYISGNFPSAASVRGGKISRSREKEAHIQESRILKSKVYFKHIFHFL